jgi:hypothetical protein
VYRSTCLQNSVQEARAHRSLEMIRLWLATRQVRRALRSEGFDHPASTRMRAASNRLKHLELPATASRPSSRCKGSASRERSADSDGGPAWTLSSDHPQCVSLVPTTCVCILRPSCGASRDFIIGWEYNSRRRQYYTAAQIMIATGRSPVIEVSWKLERMRSAPCCVSQSSL